MSKLCGVRVPDVSVNEDGSVVVAARLTTGTPAKVFLKQVNISSITYGVFDNKDGSVVIASGTVIAVADAISDTPLDWDCDALGYNFLFTFPAASFPTGGVRYKTEVKVTLTGNHVGWITFTNKAKALFTS